MTIQQSEHQLYECFYDFLILIFLFLMKFEDKHKSKSFQELLHNFSIYEANS